MINSIKWCKLWYIYECWAYENYTQNKKRDVFPLSFGWNMQDSIKQWASFFVTVVYMYKMFYTHTNIPKIRFSFCSMCCGNDTISFFVVFHSFVFLFSFFVCITLAIMKMMTMMIRKWCVDTVTAVTRQRTGRNCDDDNLMTMMMVRNNGDDDDDDAFCFMFLFTKINVIQNFISCFPCCCFHEWWIIVIIVIIMIKTVAA